MSEPFIRAPFGAFHAPEERSTHTLGMVFLPERVLE